MRSLKITISFTHCIPRCVNLAVCLTILLSVKSTILPAQLVKLDSLPIYEQSYRLFMQKKWTAERKEFVVVNKKKWWYYLPGVGYAFGLPTANLNTGLLAQIDRDRTLLAARLTSLDSRYQVEFVESLQRIRIEYRKLRVRSQQIERERQLLSKLHGIQLIHTDAFNNQTMTPEEHLRNSYQYERAVSDWRARESELLLSVLDFFALCRYDLPNTPLVELASDEGCPATEPRSIPPTDVTVISEIDRTRR